MSLLKSLIRTSVALLLALILPTAHAQTPHPQEVADPSVRVDTSTLTAPAPGAAGNPYRGDSRAIEIGRTAFNQACARCHGVDAINKGQVGPDLTLLDRPCKPIVDPAIKRMCVEDQDDYFLKSVQDGKIRVGVVHMPGWKDILSPQAIWTLRSFLESRRAP